MSLSTQERLARKKEQITLSPLFLGAHVSGRFVKSKLFAVTNSEELVYTAKADEHKRPLILLKCLVKFKPKKWIYKKLDRILLKFVPDDVENLDDFGIFKSTEMFPNLPGDRVHQYAVSEYLLELLFTKSNVVLFYGHCS